MYCKVRKKRISLTRYHGKPRFLHISEHLTEYTEIKVRCGICQISHTSDITDQHCGKDAARNGEYPNESLFRLKSVKQLFLFIEAIDKEKRINADDRQGKKKFIAGAFIFAKPTNNTNG